MRNTRPSLMLASVLTAGFLAVRVGLAGTMPSAAVQDETPQWEFSLAATGNIIPDDRDYLQPTLKADRDWLHLEARYNYEGLETGSAWVGYNFSAGKTVTVEFTPMIGGVFGDTRGVAPGFELSLDWKKLSFYSETEYLVETGNSADNYIYTWLQLMYAPCDWFSAGLVAQRTRVHDTGLDVERGLQVGLTWKNLEFTACVFNLGWEQPTVLVGVTVNF